MMQKDRIPRPTTLFHGGGGENTPADREIRYKPVNAEREQKT